MIKEANSLGTTVRVEPIATSLPAQSRASFVSEPRKCPSGVADPSRPSALLSPDEPAPGGTSDGRAAHV